MLAVICAYSHSVCGGVSVCAMCFNKVFLKYPLQIKTEWKCNQKKRPVRVYRPLLLRGLSVKQGFEVYAKLIEVFAQTVAVIAAGFV